MNNASAIHIKEEDKGKPYVHYLLIAIVCCFSFFINNQIIPADLMESRNLATAQEMVRTDNYLIPTMNGELRLEKPPLPTWIAAAIEQATPDNLVAQRYAAGIMATVMVFFLYFSTIELTQNRKIGLISALVLATCFNVILMGRTATWDIYCHSFMLGAIYFLMLALKRDGRQWGEFLLAGVFMGLSFLSKGPVSFYALLLPFLIAYIIEYRSSIKGKVVPIIAMVVIFLVISFWWNIYLLLTHPDMMLYVAHKESSSWVNHNVRPWYYYWKFPAEAGIWALFMITSIVYFFVHKKHSFKKAHTFSIIWFISSLVLLSLIPEKKTRYLLPILIPGAIVIGLYIFHCIRNLQSLSAKWTFRINATIIAVIFMAIPFVLYFIFYKNGQLSTGLLIASVVCGWGIGIYIFLSVYGKRGIRAAQVFGAIIIGMMVVEAICLSPIGNMFINPERHSIKELRTRSEVQGLPFYYNQNDTLRMELVYEINQTVQKLNTADDAQVYASTPFVFISPQPADSVFAGKKLTIQEVGIFDNNWRKTNHKRYNNDLVSYVAIITSKPEPITTTE